MININKKNLIYPALALIILSAAIVTSTSAFAQDNSNAESSLVQKIASKFGLDESEVQKVFDEAHEERHAQMQKMQGERLSQLVADGKITEDQKTLIINKQKELQANWQSNKDQFKDINPEERKSQMEAKKVELEKWATENGIDPTYLFPAFGGGRGHGPMR